MSCGWSCVYVCACAHLCSCVCVSVLREIDGTRMRYGRNASRRRKCAALGDDLLGCGCYSDMYHLPKHYFHTPSWQRNSLTSAAYQLDNEPFHMQNVYKNHLRNVPKQFKVFILKSPKCSVSQVTDVRVIGLLQMLELKPITF